MTKKSLTISNMSGMQLIVFCLCIVTVLQIFVPNMAFADSSNDAISGTLCIIVNALQGGIGKAVATIAIVVLGIGLFLGKLSWPLAVATAIGIGMIFGAANLVNFIAPSNTAAGCASN